MGQSEERSSIPPDEKRAGPMIPVAVAFGHINS
ncbi:hypothetical protein COLO4_07180 [Corchorus olitorius]|uniref:Uncharacterized protein n=1 Tax=Corchorus olitorius TaxID=93759 RepID=A0A1R3KKL8_9ROSI|nr:hypothetical protein COLO4_07180 [Corchorus olitorius]